jgi:hypothetical protein
LLRHIGVIVRREDFPLSPRELGSPADMQDFDAGESKVRHLFFRTQTPGQLDLESLFGRDLNQLHCVAN